eukprot:6464557-Amphidinium_carterae.1
MQGMESAFSRGQQKCLHRDQARGGHWGSYMPGLSRAVNTPQRQDIGKSMSGHPTGIEWLQELSSNRCQTQNLYLSMRDL